MNHSIALGFLVLASLSGCYTSQRLYDDVGSPVTTPCAVARSGLTRDCGWTLERTEPCTPGRGVGVECGCLTSACTGNPMLRICAGGLECASDLSLASADDTCGRCPSVAFLCPPEGRFTVLTGSFDTAPYGCTVSIRAP